MTFVEPQPVAPHVIRVLVVEDHLIARIGTITLLTAQADLAVCGEAESGGQALTLYRATRPDVMLIDMRLPDMDGDEVIRQVRDEFPAAACLCLSTYDGEAEITRALRAGALGYIVKDTSRTELLTALRTIAAGTRYLPAAIASKVADYAFQEQISTREVEVLRAVAKGLGNKEIAGELYISEQTVKSHVRNILEKLGVTDRAAAVMRAVGLGLIRPTDSKPRR